ncbi:DNA-directed RNA polymerase subunit beta [Streptococcaceae bacterium ESL0729]|nr:DNA-directed RNA polymerase subunit beta [Streptococcaceae bacterium ESL0729]
MQVIRYLGWRINIILLVVVLSIVAVAAGLMVGYGLIGGGAAKDILEPSKWMSIIDKLK